ncbi:MAG TPA: tetratricopeptide repeat protein, partial [Anaerolineae bacterium]|nr:tetratricopeptide repeat protein [Anaerolineae bacterium]
MMRKILLTLSLVAVFTGCGGNSEEATQRLVETGNRYFENGKFKEASIVYRRALQRDRRSAEAYYRLGMSEQRLGRYEGAIQALRRACELDVTNEDAYALLADLLLTIYISDTARYSTLLSEIQQLTERAAAQFPDSFQVARVRGFTRLAQGDYTSAIPLLREALAKQPDDQRVALWLVQAVAASGNREEAEKLARSYIDKDKSSSSLYDVLYLLYLSERNVDAAQAVLEEKCQNNPDSLVYQLQLARHFAAVGNAAQMNSTLDQALATPDRFPAVFRDVGRFYMLLRDYDRAYAVFERGAQHFPGEQNAYVLQMVEALASQGKASEGFRLL